MAKIVYPHDLRTELQKIYDSGKLYWHLPGCRLYGEPVLDKRVSHPWPGSPRRFTKTVYDDNVLPWTVQWKKEKDKDVFFGIEIIGSCKGMHYIFDRVVVPDVAGAFRYLGKEKELAKFILSRAGDPDFYKSGRNAHSLLSIINNRFSAEIML